MFRNCQCALIGAAVATACKSNDTLQSSSLFHFPAHQITFSPGASCLMQMSQVTLFKSRLQATIKLSFELNQKTIIAKNWSSHQHPASFKRLTIKILTEEIVFSSHFTSKSSDNLTKRVLCFNLPKWIFDKMNDYKLHILAFLFLFLSFTQQLIVFCRYFSTLYTW